MTFNTQGHTINWTAGADGAGALIKDGEGTLIFNPNGTRISGVVTVKGGTLRVKCTSVYNSFALTTVKDGATLEVAAGATLGSNGVTLEAGSTLALTATSNRYTDESKLIANELTLPTGEGEVATIRIDGTKLKGGEHVIATVGNEATTANVALDSASTAIDGRTDSLRVEDGKLKLKVKPNGLVIIFK